MISYMPLLRTLKNKSISIADLEVKCGKCVGSLNRPLSKGLYISTDVIELICNSLECQIDDVIAFSNEAVSTGYVKINWINLEHLVKESEYSMQRLSLYLGKAGNFLTKAKSKSNGLSPLVVEEICNALNCSKEDFVEIQ